MVATSLLRRISHLLGFVRLLPLASRAVAR
jgi:hypothetical protein